jgi:hypothetical protein
MLLGKLTFNESLEWDFIDLAYRSGETLRRTQFYRKR